jgi:hypothetical protein
MKGKLIKIEERWMVGTVCYADMWSNYIPLHPDDVKQIERDSQVFDNIEARIAAYPNVEFEIVSDTYEKPGKGNTYAKLIQSKEQQKQLITEIMDLDAKDGLYEDVRPKIDIQPITQEEMNEIRNPAYKYFDIDDTVNDTVNYVEKFADEHVQSLGFITFTNDYSNERRSSFIDGYNLAKETLYTEEQVREAIKYALNEAKEAVLWIDTYHNIVSDKFIQSLKQPKRD